jgi:UDP-glucose 4-epimerase
MPQTHAASLPTPCLVTGGAGFIGSHVVEALLERGAEVRVLDDLSGGRAANLPLHDPNLELRAGDVLDCATVASAFAGMRSCVHLAAQTVRGARDPHEVALANVVGFVNVLQAAHAHGVARVVYASSAAVYGEAGDGPLAEDRAPAPRGPAAMEKLIMEAYAALYHAQAGTRVLGLRYFNVYGPRQRDGVVARLIERIGRWRPAVLHGDGHQTRDFVHVEDAARLTLAALASPATGVCNVGTGQDMSLREVAQLVGFAFDRRPLLHFSAARRDDLARSRADVTRMHALLGGPARGLRAGLAPLVSDWAARERLRSLPAPVAPGTVAPALARGALHS